jgi:hypothetical protein
MKPGRTVVIVRRDLVTIIGTDATATSIPVGGPVRTDVAQT